MSKVMFDYTKSILKELVLILYFCKELEKAIKLLPYEIEQLREWLYITMGKPN
jgi:hypothetical protein